MHKSVWLAVASFTCAQTVSAAPDAAACRYSEQPAAAAAANKSSLKLLGTVPAEGGDVRRDTVIGVDLEYRLANFQPDTFFLMALFPTDEGNSTGPGDTSNSAPLSGAAGTVHLCVPLTQIYENEHMRWPLSMFVLMLEMHNRHGTSVASTGSVKFKAIDPPAGALEPRKDGPAEKYADSVKGSWEYFTNRSVRYKACIARFADMQPPLTKAYRAWEARHHADMDLVAEAQFELDKVRAKGRADDAAERSDATIEAQLAMYEQLPAAQMRQQCQGTLDELTDADDLTNGAIGDYLDYVKKYRAEHPEGKNP
jgi:hypothetical protein